jgi:hypothetical protein
MKEYEISYFDPEVGTWLTQIISSTDVDNLIWHFQEVYDRVKVVERDHWWYNNRGK